MNETIIDLIKPKAKLENSNKITYDVLDYVLYGGDNNVFLVKDSKKNEYVYAHNVHKSLDNTKYVWDRGNYLHFDNDKEAIERFRDFVVTDKFTISKNAFNRYIGKFSGLFDKYNEPAFNNLECIKIYDLFSYSQKDMLQFIDYLNNFDYISIKGNNICLNIAKAEYNFDEFVNEVKQYVDNNTFSYEDEERIRVNEIASFFLNHVCKKLHNYENVSKERVIAEAIVSFAEETNNIIYDYNTSTYETYRNTNKIKENDLINLIENHIVENNDYLGFDTGWPRYDIVADFVSDFNPNKNKDDYQL